MERGPVKVIDVVFYLCSVSGLSGVFWGNVNHTFTRGGKTAELLAAETP